MIKRKGKRAKGLFGGPLPPKRPKFTYDRSFQLRLVRLLWQDHKLAAAVAAYLSPKHFTLASYVYLAEVILEYAAANNHSIPKDTLKVRATHALKAGRLRQEVYDRVLAVRKTIDKPVPDRTFMRQEVARFVAHQSAREMILGSLEHLHDPKKIAKLVNKFLAAEAAVTRGGTGISLTKDIERRSERRRNYVKNGVPTGLRVDDHMKPGGAPPGSLCCVMAAPGAGKSQTLVHIARSAILESERQERVLYISLELSEDYIADRFDAAFSGVQVSALEDKAKTVRRAMAELEREHPDCLRIKEFIDEPIGVSQIEAHVRQLEREGWYPTLVIVDYADELVDESGTEAANSDSLYVSQGNVFRSLRRLANRLNVPIWTATQTQRAALNKEIVDINYLGESFNKAKICDLIIALCQTLEEERTSTVRFFIAKNRYGQKKVEMRCRVDWSRSRIRNY